MLKSRSVMSDSATPWTVPTRLLCPWDFQGKILELVVISFSSGSSPPREGPTSPALAGGFSTTEPRGKPCVDWVKNAILNSMHGIFVI